MDLVRLREITNIDLTSENVQHNQLSNDIYSIVELVKSNHNTNQGEIIAYGILNMLSDPNRYHVIPADTFNTMCRTADSHTLGNSYHIINNLSYTDQHKILEKQFKTSSVRKNKSINMDLQRYIKSSF